MGKIQQVSYSSTFSSTFLAMQCLFQSVSGLIIGYQRMVWPFLGLYLLLLLSSRPPSTFACKCSSHKCRTILIMPPVHCVQCKTFEASQSERKLWFPWILFPVPVCIQVHTRCKLQLHQLYTTRWRICAFI